MSTPRPRWELEFSPGKTPVPNVVWAYFRTWVAYDLREFPCSMFRTDIDAELSPNFLWGHILDTA